MREASPGKFRYRPTSEIQTSKASGFVPLDPTLPYGLLNAYRPFTPADLTSKFYTSVSGGEGFEALSEDIVYAAFPPGDPTTEPSFPISREPAFYAVSHFHCWAAKPSVHACLRDFPAFLPSHSKPAYERRQGEEQRLVAFLIDFPIDDVIDYANSECDWSIYPAPPGTPQRPENFFYMPDPAPRVLPTCIRDAQFRAPIVRDRHARTNIFISRDVLEMLHDRSVKGPDYSVLD